MSKPPMPSCPDEEKYNVLLSVWRKGERSFPLVLMVPPRLTGDFQLPLASCSVIQMSDFPKPPGLSLAKNRYFPSELNEGWDSHESFLFTSSPIDCGSDQSSPSNRE